MQPDTNETGRSMVEMLGVLAIIGVLSIGSIQGYTYAMNKYRANHVLMAMAIITVRYKLVNKQNKAIGCLLVV